MLKPLDYEKLIQFHIGYIDSLLTNKDSSRYGAWNAEQVTGKSPDNLGDRLLNSVFAKSVKLFICYLFLLIYLKQPKSPLQLIIPIRLLEIAHANVKRTRRRNKLSFLNFLSLLSAIYLTPSTGPFTSERCSAFNHSISNLLLWKSFSFLNSLYLHFASTFTKPWSRVFTVLLPFHLSLSFWLCLNKIFQTVEHSAFQFLSFLACKLLLFVSLSPMFSFNPQNTCLWCSRKITLFRLLFV